MKLFDTKFSGLRATINNVYVLNGSGSLHHCSDEDL